MALGQQVAVNLPFLRRYARALSGSQATGDAFVRATLEAALVDEELKRSLEDGRLRRVLAVEADVLGRQVGRPQAGGRLAEGEGQLDVDLAGGHRRGDGRLVVVDRQAGLVDARAVDRERAV